MSHDSFQPTGRARPIDLAAVGIAVGAAVLSYGVAITLLIHIPTDSRTAGVAQYLVSGLAPIIAVTIVYFTRVRSLPSLGVRRVSPRWIFIAIGGGIAAIVLSILVAVLVVVLTGPPSDIQSDYASASSGGPWLLALTLLVGAVLTPLGEELLFRGVIANWLLRFGGWIAVPVSAAIFAVSHGINHVMPVAFVIGVITALLFRATASIWPGFIVHVVYNTYVIASGAVAAAS